MVKIDNVVAATVISLLSASPSHAYIHEGKWEFENDDVQIIPKTRPGLGLEVGCYKFTPARVSFAINILDNQRKKWGSIVVKNHLYDEKAFVFTNVDNIEVGFFSNVKYRIVNITGQKVKCVKGDIGLFE